MFLLPYDHLDTGERQRQQLTSRSGGNSVSVCTGQDRRIWGACRQTKWDCSCLDGMADSSKTFFNWQIAETQKTLEKVSARSKGPLGIYCLAPATCKDSIETALKRCPTRGIHSNEWSREEDKLPTRVPLQLQRSIKQLHKSSPGSQKG